MLKIRFPALLFLMTLAVSQTAAGQFNTIYWIPPDNAPFTIDSDTQLNLLAGGSLGSFFSSGRSDGSSSNIEVNVMDGTVGDEMRAYGGTTLNLTGGSIGDRFEAGNPAFFAPVEINVDGGSLGNDVTAYSGTAFNIYSGSVGNSFTAGQLGFGIDVVMSGGSIGNDCLSNFGTFQMTGGDIGRFFFCDTSTVDLSGGTIDDFLLLFGSDVVIDGTDIGRDGTFSRSDVVMYSGSIERDLEIRNSSDFVFNGGEIGGVDISQSIVTCNGGLFTSSVDVLQNSELNLNGGSVQLSTRLQSGSSLNLTGGSIAVPLIASAGTAIEITGGNFEINGMPVSAGPTNIPAGDALTGVLTDGTVFVLKNAGGSLDSIPDGSLTLVAGAVPPRGPDVINVPSDPVPSGLRPGQTLNLATGAAVDINFTAVESEINLNDGTIERGLELVESQLNLSGGQIMFNSKAYGRSVINQSGGFVSSMGLYDNSVYHLVAGYCSSPDLFDGTVCNVTGGELDNQTTVFQGGRLNIAGGIVDRIRANAGSEVNLAGTAFQILDLTTGALIEDLTPQLSNGQRIVVPDRDITLSGTLVDGSLIELNLNSGFVSGESQFLAGSLLTVGLTLEEVTPAVSATTLEIIRGTGNAGDIPGLWQDDGDDLTISRSSFDIQSVTEFELTAHSPTVEPATLQFVLDGSVFARSAVTQEISLFNYDTMQFESLDSQSANRFGDRLVIVTATGDLSRFVEAGSGEMKARVRFQSASQRQQFSSNTDRAVWLIGG